MYNDFNRICDMQQLTVGTSAVEMPDVSAASKTVGMKNPEKVLVQAITANRFSIYLANKNTVAADGSQGGFELPPGGNVLLPIQTFKDFWAIAGSAGQKVQITFLGGL